MRQQSLAWPDRKVRASHSGSREEGGGGDRTNFGQYEFPLELESPKKDVSTTMIHTHVLNKGSRGVRSPPD